MSWHFVKHREGFAFLPLPQRETWSVLHLSRKCIQELLQFLNPCQSHIKLLFWYNPPLGSTKFRWGREGSRGQNVALVNAVDDGLAVRGGSAGDVSGVYLSRKE
jgi:hypothetical protein